MIHATLEIANAFVWHGILSTIIFEEVLRWFSEE